SLVIVWLLGLLGALRLPVDKTYYGLYIFIYFLTMLLLTDYVKEKQLADLEISRKTKELDRKNRQLKQLNDAKDDFLLLASHQLRTPATGVKQYLTLIADRYGTTVDEHFRKFIRRASESNDRQISIINDLLLVAQVDTGKLVLNKVDTDMSALVKGVIAERAGLFASRNQKIKTVYPKLPAMVHVDPVHMRIVAENLLDNASKYTPEGKQIAVEIKRQRDLVGLRVKDQGIGLDKKDYHKLFRKFSRINNPASGVVEGSGLGLYWTKKIVKMHRGEIRVSSSRNKGSAFEVIMPRVK
ncbi:MAG: sensor histidine kinase, partial [Candidatus Saccharimonadales bacterium]